MIRAKASEHYDVAVVGGGMVGIPMALGLSARGFKTLLIERYELTSPPVSALENSFDARSTAISLGSVEILEALQLWDEKALSAHKINTVHVSEQGRMGTARIERSDLNLDALGYVVPNMSVGTYFYQRLQQSDVYVADGCAVSRIAIQPDCAVIYAAHEEQELEFETKLMVIADGSDSHCAKLLGMDYLTKHYHQHALIANVQTELPNQGVAFERFAKSGPAALLPLTESTSALVWTLPENSVADVLEMADAQFCAEVEGLFGSRLGRITRVSKRSSYPLALKQIREQARDRVVVVGNAAHSLHPVAGQGFNLALRGVAGILEGLNGGPVELDKNPFWSYEVLKKFVAEHSFEQAKIVNFSDQLIELFSVNSAIPGIARSLGLATLNSMSSLKAEFAKHTMGRAQSFNLAETGV